MKTKAPSWTNSSCAQVDIQRRLSHNNIVQFRGACCEYLQPRDSCGLNSIHTSSSGHSSLPDLNLQVKVDSALCSVHWACLPPGARGTGVGGWKQGSLPVLNQQGLSVKTGLLASPEPAGTKREDDDHTLCRVKCALALVLALPRPAGAGKAGA